MATYGFPQCSDGDAKIHLTTEPHDKLILHSYVLALHSPCYKVSLSDRWNGGDTSRTSLLGSSNVQSKNGPKAHWVYKLHFKKVQDRPQLELVLNTDYVGSSTE